MVSSSLRLLNEFQLYNQSNGVQKGKREVRMPRFSRQQKSKRHLYDEFFQLVTCFQASLSGKPAPARLRPGLLCTLSSPGHPGGARPCRARTGPGPLCTQPNWWITVRKNILSSVTSDHCWVWHKKAWEDYFICLNYLFTFETAKYGCQWTQKRWMFI